MLFALLAFLALAIVAGLAMAIWPHKLLAWGDRTRQDILGERSALLRGLRTPRVGGILIVVFAAGMIVLLLTVPNVLDR